MGFNKKVLSKAVSELGKAKAPAKPRDIITDPAGQWKYPGQKTRIPGSSITMQGVNYPVWAQPNVGPGSMMQPNQDYEFPNADYVDETPMARKGGTLKSHKYSSNISATNKLFTKNKLFEKKKSKIFDPNAKFKSGGSKLGPINLDPNPLSHYELNYGYNLPTEQDGGENEDEYMDLTDEEIQAYRDGGYVVEELPEHEIGGYVQHELVKAQNGKTVKTFNRDIKDQDAQSNTGWSSAPVEKKKVQPTVKQKQAQKSFDKNFKVTDKSKYEKIEDKIVKAQQDLKDWGKEKGISVTNADLENVANQQWSFAGVGQQDRPGPDMMQATPEQSNSSRAWEYATNPFTAAEYAISGGGAENMPHNINEMRMAGVDPGVVQGRNLVGNTLNSTVNLLDAGDKVVRNTARGNYGEAALEAMRFIPGGGLLDDAVRLGLKPGVKALGKTFNTTKGKLAKFIPERAPGTPSTGGGNLNAGISPELITNAIGPKNKALANIADNTYFNLFGNKTVNKFSPLNLIPGYGSKLEGAVKPLGNVIGNSIKNGNLVESRSLFNKAKGLVKKGPDADLTTKVGKTNASDIYSASFNNATDGSKINIGPANQQGFIGKNFRKGNEVYPIQNTWGTNLKQVPLTSSDVNLHRRLPFSNRYVPIDKEKLMNNKFQWATTGAGLQKVGEKFAASPITTAGVVGGYTATNYDPLDYVEDEGVREQMRIENLAAPSDVPTRAQAVLENVGSSISTPSEYLQQNADPYFLRTAATAVKENLKQGGTIEKVWEDQLDEHTIELLRKAGYTVEELD